MSDQVDKRESDRRQNSGRTGKSMEALTTAVLTVAALLATAAGVAATEAKSFSAIYSFGDSMTDTGNLLLSGASAAKSTIGRLPYGETFFGKPTGRCSDGRLVLDFLAEAAGLPPVPPYLSVANFSSSSSLPVTGLNFAVAGATALGAAELAAAGVQALTNVSLAEQVRQFLDFRGAFCARFGRRACGEHFAGALFVLGEIGGNDYDLQMVGTATPRTPAQVERFVAPVVAEIGAAIAALVDRGGARRVAVLNNVPVGCFPYYLAQYPAASHPRDALGCIPEFNDFAARGNDGLAARVRGLQRRWLGRGQARVAVVDQFGAFMAVLRRPRAYGIAETGRACCGAPGTAYNFNVQELCGATAATSRACPSPRSALHWDGVHLTDAAHAAMAALFLEPRSNFSSPPLRSLFFSSSAGGIGMPPASSAPQPL